MKEILHQMREELIKAREAVNRLPSLFRAHERAGIRSQPPA